MPEAYFTHISHQLGKHQDVEKTLPDGLHLAYDGLTDFYIEAHLYPALL